MINFVQANALSIPLADKSVQCVVTSPPYWSLRDYGVANQLGLERTPEEYVANMVQVFREVWRVLRDDGTLWLNLGDSYNGSAPNRTGQNGYNDNRENRDKRFSVGGVDSLKPKDLVGIPWRVAFALQADGWVLRSEIIWHKPNPMPESVTDRPTKSHEQIFLFSKGIWKGHDRGMFEYISDEDARWLALLLDTEGNICAKRAMAKSGQNHCGTQICFANTNKELIDRTREIIGRGSFAIRKGKNADMYYLQLTHIQAANLLYRIYPYLIVKNRQAKLAIYLQDLIAESGQERRTKAGQLRGRMRDDKYTDELEEIWKMMKSLNHFGDPEMDWIPEPSYGRWDSQRYYYDAEAVKEESEGNSGWEKQRRNGNGFPIGGNNPTESLLRNDIGRTGEPSTHRNRRSVWTIATAPYSGAHFATFPPALVEPCILAGTSERGACPKCGKPWERVVERGWVKDDNGLGVKDDIKQMQIKKHGVTSAFVTGGHSVSDTTGWQPACTCYGHFIDVPTEPPSYWSHEDGEWDETRKVYIAHDDQPNPIPCTVLDPFSGSGTVGLVARKYNRQFVGIELNADYIELAKKRTKGIQPVLGGL